MLPLHTYLLSTSNVLPEHVDTKQSVEALVARSDFARGVLVARLISVNVEAIAAASRRESVAVAPDVSFHGVAEK